MSNLLLPPGATAPSPNTSKVPEQEEEDTQLGGGSGGSQHEPPRVQFLDQTLEWDSADLLLRPFSPLCNFPRACQPVFLEIARRTA
eukprot:15472695-Alexandrium_andersonii.AAC.1